MTLAPYHVSWGFFALTLVVIAYGMAWLVYPGWLTRWTRRLWLSDAVAAWLFFAALLHSLATLNHPLGGMTAGSGALMLLWGSLGVYGGLRLLPTPLRREVLTMGWVVGIWGWSIAAGYQYIAQLEQDARWMAERPETLFSSPARKGEPLFRAHALGGIEPRLQGLLEELMADVLEGRNPPPTRVSLARTLLFPVLVERLREEQGRLHAHQIFQMLLLGGVLLAWGFGTRPEI